MTVAVHIDVAKQESTGTQVITALFTALAAEHPSSHFILIFDQPFTGINTNSPNITPVVSGPQIRNPLLRHYFYNFKLPRLLNKYNADIFCSNTVSSFRTTVPQCIFVHDLAFNSSTVAREKIEGRYLKRFALKFFRKAAGIVITNRSLRSALEENYSIAPAKIYEIGIPCLTQPHVTPEDVNDSTRERISEGRHYFIFLSTPLSRPNITLALKAFSIFKKWQKSGMKLLVLNPDDTGGFEIPNLSTYKFRDDVQVISADQAGISMSNIIGASYGALYLPVSDEPEAAGLLALANGIPLVTINSSFQQALYGDAALYAASDEKAIGAELMKLYKDEAGRVALIHAGYELVNQSQPAQRVTRLWEILQSLQKG